MKNKKPLLIVIAGPTAIGKTSAALKVAQSYDTEIISADSRQIYKEMKIGVARPSASELSMVKHHFIAEISIHEKYSAAQYEKQALSRIDEILSRSNYCVLCGGTGLYIKAIIDGLDNIPASDPEIELHYQNLFENEGIQMLQSLLNIHDPDYADKVDQSNSRRLIRALTVYKMTGQPFSSFLNKKKAKRPFDTKVIILQRPRKELYQRIEMRVDEMINHGLEEEVRRLKPHLDLRSMQTVGYREFIPFFKGECTIDEAINKIKQHTRNYAKRQITWLNNQINGIMLHPDELDQHLAHFKR